MKRASEARSEGDLFIWNVIAARAAVYPIVWLDLFIGLKTPADFKLNPLMSLFRDHLRWYRRQFHRAHDFETRLLHPLVWRGREDSLNMDVALAIEA
jgi:hypothetical protein